MALSFEHSQYLAGVRMKLGETGDEFTLKAPFTDREFYRSLVDTGFPATVDFVSCDLFFEGGASVVQNVTWKWQLRSVTQSSWTDLHTAVTEQWTGATDTGIRAGLDAAALGANNSAPFEVRLICTASTAADISVRIGNTNKVPAVLVYGEAA